MHKENSEEIWCKVMKVFIGKNSQNYLGLDGISTHLPSEVWGLREAGRDLLPRCLLPMEEITIKTPNSKCRLYQCIIEFIDWRYSQSCWYFRPLLWTMPLYLYVYVQYLYSEYQGRWKGPQTPDAKFLYRSIFKKRTTLMIWCHYSYLVHAPPPILVWSVQSYSSYLVPSLNKLVLLARHIYGRASYY